MIYLNSAIFPEPLELKHFPDGTLNLRTPEVDPTAEIVIEWNYENDGELFAIICLAKKYQHHRRKILVMPYVPHARMDRVKHPETEVFTLKYFCEVINSLNFDEVQVWDVHSSVTPALLNNCVALDGNQKRQEAIADAKSRVGEGNLVLFFPDEGAMKRYSADAKMPYAFGVKSRNWETGIITKLTIEGDVSVQGKDVLIIDDICSYGGTFLHSARALRANGANRIFLYITHCEQNVYAGKIFDAENKGLIEGIYTAGTLPALRNYKEEREKYRVAERNEPWVQIV